MINPQTPEGFQAVIPDWLIIGAVRYAIGRMSYQVSITTEWVIQNWYLMNEHTKAIIIQDVEEAFREDDRHREAYAKKEVTFKCFALGHDCDRESWLQVRKLWTHVEGEKA